VFGKQGYESTIRKPLNPWVRFCHESTRQPSFEKLGFNGCFSPPSPPPIAGTRRLEMVMKDPYNNPAKDKVTLSFAGCYDKPKVVWTGMGNPAQNPV